MFTPGICHKIQ